MDNLYLTLFFNILLFVTLLGFQVIYRVRAHSLKYALSSLDENKAELFCETRIRRAKDNQAEFLILLFPVVSAVYQLNIPIEHIVISTVTIMFARTAYVLCTLFGIAYFRSTIWAISILAWGYLLFEVLNQVIF